MLTALLAAIAVFTLVAIVETLFDQISNGGR